MKPGKWEITLQAARPGSEQHVSYWCLSAQETASYMSVAKEKLPPGFKFTGITNDGKGDLWHVTFQGGSYATSATADGATFRRVMHTDGKADADDVVYTGRWRGGCTK